MSRGATIETGWHDAWLRRLSAYHSDAATGALAPDERAAVEAHLRACDECQRALAAYQRFFALAASPLRLPAPSPALARQDRYFVAATTHSTQRRGTHMPPSTPANDPANQPTETYDDATTRPMRAYRASPAADSYPSYPPDVSYPATRSPIGAPGGRTPRRGPRWRGVAAALVAALLIVAFASTLIPRILAHTGNGTPTATIPAGTPINKHIPTPTTTTPGPSPTIPPAPTGFVCANAPGSNDVYAFINTDQQLYSVTGCGAPQRLTNIPPLTSPNGGSPFSAVGALGFSPSNTLLMVERETSLSTGAGCQEVLNIQSDALNQTPFCTQSIYASQSQYPAFIGWLDDNTFLESLTDHNTRVQVVRVDATSFAQTTITTVPWVANLANTNTGTDSGFALRNGALFYAGYADGSTTQAALRRYSLTNGSDQQIVPLGIAGYGGCQVTESPCAWTGPWDVSPDGAHIIYHNPGPQISLSDTSNPSDTALFYANSDGSGASQVFAPLPPQPNTYVPPTTPVISPNGSYAIADFPNPIAPTRYVALASPGHVMRLPSRDGFTSWRPDSAAMLTVLVPTGAQPYEYALYTLATGQLTVLTANTSGYVWGN